MDGSPAAAAHISMADACVRLRPPVYGSSRVSSAEEGNIFPSPLLAYIYIKNSLPTTTTTIHTHTYIYIYIEKDVCKFSCSSFRTGV